MRVGVGEKVLLLLAEADGIHSTIMTIIWLFVIHPMNIAFSILQNYGMKMKKVGKADGFRRRKKVTYIAMHNGKKLLCDWI